MKTLQAIILRKIQIKNFLKKFIFFGLFFHLNCCFLIPRLKIIRAFQKKDCQKLRDHFIYDLSIKELKRSAALCLEKGKYLQAAAFLNHIEENAPLLEKLKAVKQKSEIYMNNLQDYSNAAAELEKFLSLRPGHFSAGKNLVIALMKSKSFKKALKRCQNLLSLSLKENEKLELEFIQARLLFLLYRKREALAAFQSIREKNLKFFKSRQGGFYLALLLEEDKRFTEAIQELQKADWAFLENKILHWKNRKANSPEEGL